MAENFFAQFHDQPPDGAPSGDVTPAPGDKTNYFSRFHADQDNAAPRATPTKPDGTPLTRVYITPKRPDAGVSDAIGRGVAQGATAGFADELQALSEAGGAGKKEQTVLGEESLNGIQHLIGGFIKYLARDPEALAKYDEAVKREREANKAAEENHSIIYPISQAAGVAATLPMGGEASQAAGWGARALAAARQGAIYGGLSGAGEGEGTVDTLTKAASGTVLGGIVGGVAAPAIEAVGHGVRYLTKKAGNIIRGATDPEAEAARQYLTALEADRQADPNFVSRMTPAEFHANPDARLMDLGGGAVKRLADVASMTSPKAQTMLKHEIDKRFEGQSGRFSDWFRSNFHYPDAYGQQQALDQVAKSVNRPAYLKAYREGDKPLMSPALEQLTGSPAVVEAMKRAATSGKDRAITEGYGAFNPGVTIENGVVRFNKGKNGVPTFPNLQFWDQTRRELSDAAKKAARAGADGEASVLGKLAQSMNDELDKLVPSYQEARQGAAGFFGAENALEAGQKFVTSNAISLSEARAALAKMTPAERRLFQDGFVSDFVDKVVNTTGDRRDILQKIAQNPQARAKLELVLGREKYAELEAKIRVEGIFDEVRKAVQGNSWTARRLYDMGLAGGAGLGAHGSYSTDPKEIATGALIAALASGGKRINTQVATKLAEMLISRDPAVAQKGFKAISGNSRIMDALRDADTKIGRMMSNFAPVNPALSAAGVARADDQKRAPRPPGQ